MAAGLAAGFRQRHGATRRPPLPWTPAGGVAGPGNGSAPTTSWAEGQVIVQDVVLPVPPGLATGAYAIAIGFYDAAYGQRLSVDGAAEHLLPQNRAVLTQKILVRP